MRADHSPDRSSDRPDPARDGRTITVAEMLDQAKYGLVGKVVQVDIEAIEAAVGADSIPVIASLGETAGGQILNVNADWAANELVKRMQPYKIIFLTGTGGILDERGKLV